LVLYKYSWLLMVDNIALRELLDRDKARINDGGSGKDGIWLNNNMSLNGLNNHILGRLDHGDTSVLLGVIQILTDLLLKEEEPANTKHDKDQGQIEKIVIEHGGKTASHIVQGVVHLIAGAIAASQVSKEALGAERDNNSVELERELGDLDNKVEHSAAVSHAFSHMSSGVGSEPFISIVHGVAKHAGEDNTQTNTSNNSGGQEPALDALESLHLVTVVDDLAHLATTTGVPRNVAS
jgi:hypothetical protein